MTCDFLAQALPGVQKISPYVTGKPIEEVAREFGVALEDIVKLASNENPIGPSPKVAAAIQAQIADLARYPDGAGYDLKQKLCALHAINANQITLGNGSNDILDLIAKAWVEPGLNAVYSQHAFVAYPLAILAAGGECREVPAKHYAHDLTAMLQAMDANTRIVFVSNPNNPTGTAFSQAELEQFLAQVPSHVLVVMDEAYIEYCEQGAIANSMPLLGQYPNLIVSRTFSKAYGLAALRVGYAVSSPVVADVLNRVRQPFNVNSMALAAAAAAVEDQAHIDYIRSENRKGMQQLEAGFSQLGLSWIPSYGNFVAVDFKRDAAPINQALLEKGVIVRPVAGYDMPTFLRVSVGTAKENTRFLEVLTSVLQHA